MALIWHSGGDILGFLCCPYGHVEVSINGVLEKGRPHSQMKADTDTQGRKLEAVLAAALIAAAVGAGLPGDLMPKGHAEESLVERRRADANKRKELLSKAYVPVKASHSCQEAQAHACMLGQSGTACCKLTMYQSDACLCRRSDALKRGGIDAGSSGAPAPALTQEASVNAAVSHTQHPAMSPHLCHCHSAELPHDIYDVAFNMSAAG